MRQLGYETSPDLIEAKMGEIFQSSLLTGEALNSNSEKPR